MRKLNAVISVLIIILFLIHGVFGALLMMGMGPGALKPLARTAEGLIWIHAAIGIKLSIDTLTSAGKAKAFYLRENRLFLARRISGFATMIFMIIHMESFSYMAGGALRLKYFGPFSLAANGLLLLCTAVHVISNTRPVLISFGLKSFKERAADILIVLSVLLLFMAVGLLFYFIRWNT